MANPTGRLAGQVIITGASTGANTGGSTGISQSINCAAGAYMVG